MRKLKIKPRGKWRTLWVRESHYTLHAGQTGNDSMAKNDGQNRGAKPEPNSKMGNKQEAARLKMIR